MTMALQTTDSQVAPWTATEQELIKKQIAPNCTDLELALFAKVCQRTGLDPFARQIYAIKRGSGDHAKMTIQTGIDGYRLAAARSNAYAGSDDIEYDTEDGEHPNWARATVYRLVQGQRVPFAAKARWAEYCQKYDGKPSDMWQKFPYLMLGKCAEALALRKAFPAELSGMYTDEEMTQADNVVEGSVREVQQENHATPTQHAIAEPKKPTLVELKRQMQTLLDEYEISKAGLAAWASEPERRYSSGQYSHVELIIAALKDGQQRNVILFHNLAQSKTLAASTLLAMMRARTTNWNLTMGNAWVAYVENEDEWNTHIAHEQAAHVAAS